MKEVQHGIFAMEEGIKGSPQQLAIRPYTLAGVFDTPEEEDLAARLLSFSQWAKQWVGVAYVLLLSMLREEEYYAQRYQQSMDAYFNERARYEERLAWYSVWCWCTLGVVWLFGSPPVPPEQPQCESPASAIFRAGGPVERKAALDKALQSLLDKGMIGSSREQRGDEECFVLFPTRELVEHIRRSQMQMLRIDPELLATA